MLRFGSLTSTGGSMSHDVSRRSFFGGLAAALGYLGLGPSTDLFAQTRPGAATNAVPRMRGNDDYDAIAHLSSNENCWGPPESVMKAMNNAWKCSNRYGYPDANIVGEIARSTRREAGQHPAGRRLRRNPRRRRDDVPARRQKCSVSSRRTLGVPSTRRASRRRRSSCRSARITGRTWRR